MPDIMQHSFGKPGSGGPIMAFERLLENSDFSYGRLLQAEPAGGVNINLIRRFILEIRKYRPELIHVRGLGNEGFHAVLAARLAGVPNILVSVHGTHRDLKTARQSRFRQWIVVNVLERLTLVLATHIATVCEYAFARSFLASYRSKLVGTVPNGVEIPKKVATKSYTLRLQLGIPVSYLVGVCVSRITMEKGYLVLAEALKRLDAKTKKFAILVIGGGDEGGRIKSHFSGLNSIKVVFLGHQKEVEKYLAISDFFVFPSLHENLSNALIEAMSNGLPVIATDVGGNTEVVKKGGGVLIPAQDSHALARAINQFLVDPNMLTAMGSQGRENIRSNYSIQQMVAGWEGIYSQILGDRCGKT